MTTQSIRHVAANDRDPLAEPRIFSSIGCATILLRGAFLELQAAKTAEERAVASAHVAACWQPFIKWAREAQA